MQPRVIRLSIRNKSLLRRILWKFRGRFRTQSLLGWPGIPADSQRPFGWNIDLTARETERHDPTAWGPDFQTRERSELSDKLLILNTLDHKVCSILPIQPELTRTDEIYTTCWTQNDEIGELRSRSDRPNPFFTPNPDRLARRLPIRICHCKLLSQTATSLRRILSLNGAEHPPRISN